MISILNDGSDGGGEAGGDIPKRKARRVGLVQNLRRQVGHMHKPRRDLLTGFREIGKHPVHQMVADKSAGRVGDGGGDALFANG